MFVMIEEEAHMFFLHFCRKHGLRAIKNSSNVFALVVLVMPVLLQPKIFFVCEEFYS
jgi:hypothetical protein